MRKVITLVLALGLCFTVAFAVPVRSEAAGSDTATSEEATSTKPSFWKILVVAGCIGVLAAGYGVSDMIIRQKKMDKMTTRVRMEKGLIKDPEKKDVEPAKPAGIPKDLDLSALEEDTLSEDDPAYWARIAEAQEYNQHPANRSE